MDDGAAVDAAADPAAAVVADAAIVVKGKARGEGEEDGMRLGSVRSNWSMRRERCFFAHTARRGARWH